MQASLGKVASAALLQLVCVQRAILPVRAQMYKDLGSGYCRDGNGLYPNTCCRTDGHSKATCQAQCSSDAACVAFQAGAPPDTHCCIYGAALSPETAPPDWQFGYGNGGTDGITQAIHQPGRSCYKKASCGSTADCDVLLGAGYHCEDRLCLGSANTTSTNFTATAATTTASTERVGSSTTSLAVMAALEPAALTAMAMVGVASTYS